MERRNRLHPEEVTIDGFLLLDTAAYEFVTAHVPLDIFWKMKALDIVGNTRSMNRARVAHSRNIPEIGSIWLVDAVVEEAARNLGLTITCFEGHARCRPGGQDIPDVDPRSART